MVPLWGHSNDLAINLKEAGAVARICAKGSHDSFIVLKDHFDCSVVSKDGCKETMFRKL